MTITKIMTTAILLSTAMILSSASYAAQNQSGRNNTNAPVVYVTSQGLYYDSIVLTDLPQKGEFQELIADMNGLSTEFGPGDVGHLGGRWWIDTDMNGEMDSYDYYFLCPLLGPGRENP